MIRRHTHILVLPFLLLACSDGGDQDQAPTPADWQSSRAVSVAAVEMRPLGGTLQASGLIVPFEEVALGSQLSGYRITAVLVDEGTTVSAGQPLARLDPTLLEANIQQERAKVAQAEAKSRQALAEADRVKDLDGSGALPDEQIAARRSQAMDAVAGTTAARAQLQALLTQRAQMVIRAPSSGIILERGAREGTVVSAGGDPLFRIAGHSRMELDAEVPEDGLASIAAGTKARVVLSSGVRLIGIVRRVSPRVDPKTKLGRARISLPADPQVRAGGFARVEFDRIARRKPAVPETAIQYDGAGTSVLAVGEDNRVHSVAVRTGVRSGGWTELREGPPAGTRITLGGSAFLLDGDIIRPVMKTGV